MDIITRNFFRLLRAGTFGEKEEIDPMSAWKWQRVYQFSVMHEVTALLYDGIGLCSNQFFMKLPPSLLEQWQKTVGEIEQLHSTTSLRVTELFALLGRMQVRPVLLKGVALAALYDHPSHRMVQGIDIFFPFETQGKKADRWAWDNGTDVTERGSLLSYEWQSVKMGHHHRLISLTNSLHSHTLQSITEKEFRENPATFATIDGMRIEQLSPTLELLYLLLSVACNLLNNGINIGQLTDVGVFLRKAGDKVDFVKLQTWIERLHMKSMAQLTGTLLVQLMAFGHEEIPFMTERESDTSRIMQELFKLRTEHEWHFSQKGDIFVHTANSSAMFWQVRHSARYFRYYPTESTTNLFASFAHSLSHIEE